MSDYAQADDRIDQLQAEHEPNYVFIKPGDLCDMDGCDRLAVKEPCTHWNIFRLCGPCYQAYLAGCGVMQKTAAGVELMDAGSDPFSII